MCVFRTSSRSVAETWESEREGQGKGVAGVHAVVSTAVTTQL